MSLISEVFNSDCVEGMKQFPDKFFDLAIVDPPFDVKRFKNGGSVMKSASDLKQWDFKPSKEYFAELKRVSVHQIIWGGNYFDLPASPGWIVWRKLDIAPSFGQCELAWSSFDMPISYWASATEKSKIHPCQKPVLLYAWLLDYYAKKYTRIIDTHLGSQSSRIAAYKLGFEFWGWEIDKFYFEDGCERFGRTIHEPLFEAAAQLTQSKLL